MHATDRSSAPPQPWTDSDSAPFWAALDDGVLRLPFSPATGRFQFPPLERCRDSGEPLEWREIAQSGRVVTFIVQHRAIAPGFEALLPYPLALVAPDDAPDVRLPMRIAGTHGEGVAVGARVRIAIEPHPGGAYSVPVAYLIPS
jgi:uncharacterized OB-fold protein